MKRFPVSKRGFSLIEVLLAMVILSLGVTSILGATQSCLTLIKRSRNLEVARGLLLRVDLENPIEDVDLDETSDSGKFDDVDGFTWSREIVMDDEELRPGLFIVTTRVQWSERGRDSYEEVTTYRYAPEAESLTREL